MKGKGKGCMKEEEDRGKEQWHQQRVGLMPVKGCDTKLSYVYDVCDRNYALDENVIIKNYEDVGE